MNILLICSAGMSTSMVVKKMQEEAVAKGLEANIWAIGEAKTSEELAKADIVMLGPQIKYREKSTKDMVAGRIPVVVIDMMKYGRLDGKAILEDAIKAVESFK